MRHFVKSLVVAAVAALTVTIAPAAVAAPPDTAGEPDQPAHAVVFREEAVIAADPSRVWQLLVDLPGYASWNPWVVRADGRAEVGADVEVDVILGPHRMRAQHIVLAVEPETRFCWRDAGWNAWFVYGQRCRMLRQQADGTVLFQQELLLDGPLAGVASLLTGQAMRDGMAAETAALKAHAERPA